MHQFEENLGIMNVEELNRIKALKVMIVGLGGLGGHVANTLVRLGVQHLTLSDSDRFTLSNLNRQLFSHHETINEFKVEVVRDGLLEINPNVDVIVYEEKVQHLEDYLFADADVIIDCVDHIPTKLYLETMASKAQKPLLHGAIAGWYGQFGFVMPNSAMLKELYQDRQEGIEKTLRSPSFTPAIVANMMVAELVKYIKKDKGTLINELASIDLLTNEIQSFFKR